MHRFRARTTATALLISICLMAGGCTTARTLPRPDENGEILPGGIGPGSKVTVTLRSGEIRTFRLTAIGSNALIGKNVRIPFADIEKLQEKKFSMGRSVGLAAGAAVILVGAFAAYMIHVHKNDD